LAAAVAVAVALAASCRTAPARVRVTPPTPTVLPEPPALETYVPNPSIRVGVLVDVPRVSVASTSAMPVSVWSAAPGQTAGRSRMVQRATFEGVPVAATPAGRFRVQVGSLVDEPAARELAARVRDLSGLLPSVRWNEPTRTYQVRVGEFATREEARTLAGRLEAAGLGECWVAEEAPPVGLGRMHLAEAAEELGAATILPTRPGDVLTVDGVRYRGLVQVRPNVDGTLTVVNLLNIEDYLRGVVPNELSPEAYPQIEALKAQAVAARTYALRNRGGFEAKGYDICATPACQFYKGLGSEHPMTDKAVEETRGMAAVYHGALINALYTSTCGGYTEDAANIFEGQDTAPYLKGVACTPERSAWATLKTAAPTVSVGDEADLSRDTALLVALGVLEPKMYAAASLKGVPSDVELKTWTQRLVTAVRRAGCPSRVEPPLNRRGAFLDHLVASLCWEERGRRLLSPGDPDYLLQVEDREDLRSDGERISAALLLQEGVLAPFPDNTLRPNVSLSRAQAVSLLARTALRAGPPTLVNADFEGIEEGGSLKLKRGEDTETHPLDPQARLFRSFDGTRVPSSQISLAAGDKVHYILKDAQVVYLEAEQSRWGAAADRTSRFYRWEVRLTPAEVAQGIARYGAVGKVKDVVPRRIGVSGRVVELAVEGSDGELLLRGLKIRWALGLRENLFAVDRETDGKGAIERFVFTGKGWGHGVGLCQVGAFGMAQAGASYEDILRHYYTDISLKRVY
jgi:stage II sporulation protein D